MKNITEKERGKGVTFVHTRRITGYLTYDTQNWCTGKKSELKDRVPQKLNIA